MNISKNIKIGKVYAVNKQSNSMQNYVVRNGNRKSRFRPHFARISAGMIWIEKVNWLDKDNGEADIYLTDGIYNVVCFSSSFYGDEEQEFNGQIYSYEAENVYKKLDKKCEIRKKDDGIYHLEGKMVDRENKIVRIGEFLISLSDSQIDKDILLNDYLEFEISRLDVY